MESQQQQYSDLSRRDIRSLIFHILYAMEGFEYSVSLSSIVDMINRGYEWDISPGCEVITVAQAVIESRNTLDEEIKPLLSNWRLERIGVCTKLVLRLAVWELKETDTPSTVIINEAIELAKCFSEKDAYRFINGVLDEFCKKHDRQ